MNRSIRILWSDKASKSSLLIKVKANFERGWKSKGSRYDKDCLMLTREAVVVVVVDVVVVYVVVVVDVVGVVGGVVGVGIFVDGVCVFCLLVLVLS